MANSKVMKKVFSTVISVILIFVLLLSFTACNGPDSKKTEGPSKTIGNEDMEVISDSSKLPVINESDTIVVVDPKSTKSLTGKSKLTKSEEITLVSLQGIVAQTKAEIYIGKESDTILEYMKNEYGKTIEVVDDFKALLDRYKSHITDSGYVKIKYSPKATVTSNLNQASTISGAEKWLLVPCEKIDDDAYEAAVKEAGFTMKLDLYYGTDNEIMVFEKYKDQLSTKVVAALHPQDVDSRDFGIAHKAAFFYYKVDTTSSQELLNVYGSLNPLATVIGWEDVVAGDLAVQQGATTEEWIDRASYHGVTAIPVTEVNNLSLFYSIIEEGNLQQKESKDNATDGKHYVTVIMNDGGDIGTTINNYEDSKTYASEDRANYPVGWTISPSLYDYASPIMSYLYNNMTDNEHFVASVSGFARADLNVLAEHNKGKTLDAYMNRTNDLLGKSGIKYITYSGSLSDASMIDKYGKLSNVSGGFVLTPNYKNPTGGIKWVDGKPFIADREVIREALNRGPEENKQEAMTKFVGKAVERLNQYEANKSSLEGYSIVNVHTTDYAYNKVVSGIYDKVDAEKIQFVTPDEFMDLIIANVEKVDVDSANILSTKPEPTEE